MKNFQEYLTEKKNNLVCIRTTEEIEQEIKRICSDADNFTSDNYGSEAADNGKFQISYSKYSSENTMRSFVKWLFEKE